MPGTRIPDRNRAVELILRQIESLPTLSPVAVRVLELSGSSQGDVREITRLIESDPALTARVLALCGKANRGLSGITTVERAVVLIGMEAIRTAMLSIEVIGLLTQNDPLTRLDDAEEKVDRSLLTGAATHGFDHRGLWRHSLAVACASEIIAQKHPNLTDEFSPAEAFLCGLLHDLGKAALLLAQPDQVDRGFNLANERNIFPPQNCGACHY